MRRGAPLASPIPRGAAALGALALAYLALPLILMGARVPWTRLGELLSSEEALAALGLSLRTALVALGLDILLGVPAALLLSRRWRGVGAARVLVALPLSLPPVVAGMALIAAFGRRGLIGRGLEALGAPIAFSEAAVVMAQVFVSLPFLIVTVEAALRAREEGLEETAASLGASPTRILVSVTLPQAMPGLARGSALALARALGEFGATLTFAGSLQGVTRTLPLQIYLARESDPDLALALAMVLLAAAALIVGLTEGWGRGRSPRAQEQAPVRESAPVRVGSARDGRPGAAGVGVVGPEREKQAGGAGEDRESGEIGPLSRLDPVEVRVKGRIEARDWELDCVLPAGGVTAVMGRNGSGKSTLAQVLAGALPLDSGRVGIGRRIVDGEGVFVAPRDRAVALVGQRPRLFPSMSVLDNVAFPLKARGVPRGEARAAAARQLDAVGCAGLAERRVDALSGGQAARVAIARALVFDPDLLILDEPTASLDVEASMLVSSVIARRLARERITVLLITHDIAEALALASRLLVLEGGRLVESGEPASILTAPASLFGARLAGLNVVTGEALGLGPDSRVLEVESAAGRLAGLVDADSAITEGAPVALLFAPDAVALSRAPLGGSPRTVLRGRVLAVEETGGVLSIGLDLGGPRISARLTAGAWAELGASIGEELCCTIKAMQIRAIPLSRA